MAKIEYVIEVITSSRDTSGNCYHFACITRTSDGESISGMIDGPSNGSYYMRELGFEWDQIKSIESVIPIRRFNALVKGIKTRIGLPELEKFTGVKVWHLATKGVNNWNALCHSESTNLFDVSYANDKLDGSPNVNGATGVWCSACRRANYYNQRKAV